MTTGLSSVGGQAVRTFLSDAGLVLFLKILSAILSYGMIILLARWLEPGDYGRYATITSAIVFGAYLCGLGANTSVVRYLGEYRARGQTALAWGAVIFAEHVIVRTTAACAVLASAAFLGIWAMGWMDSPWVYILAALLIMPAFTLMDVQSGVLRSYDRIVSALIPKDFGWRLSVIAAGLVLVFTLPAEDRLLPLIAASGIAITAFALIQRMALRRRVIAEEGTPAPERDMPAWRRASLTMWVTQLARTAYGALDVLIVGLLLSVEVAGLYFVAVRTAEVINFLYASLNLIVGPKVARFHAEGRVAECQQFLSMVVALLFAIASGAFGFCLIAGPWILSLFGPDFADAYIPLLLIVGGQMIYAGFGSAGVILTMTGHERTNAKLLIICACLTLLGVAIAAPIYGVVGAAAASALGTAIWSGAVWFAARRLTPFDTSIFSVPGLISRRLVQ